MKRNFKWYIEQLLPLKYKTEYSDMDDGKKYQATWRMWLGKVYNAVHTECD